MIENLVWFIAWSALIFGLVHVIPKSFISAVTAYKRRNIESPTKELPSAACPTCAGAWGPWSKIYEDARPNNPAYPTTYGSHIIRSQVRACNECGFGERRVL